MKREWVDEMVAKKRVKLGLWKSINYYFPALLIFLIALFPVVFPLIQHQDFNSVKESLDDEFWLWTLAITLGLIVWRYQYAQLKLKEYRIIHTAGQFTLALNRVRKESSWQIQEFSCNYVKAERFGEFLDSSDGEVIILIRDEGRILINSLAGFTGRGYLAFGRNRKNVQDFVAHLQNVIDQKDCLSQGEPGAQVNEWSLKRTLVRLIMYPLCLVMIIGALYFVIPQNFILGIVPLVLGSSYIYLDLKLLLTWQKGRRKS